MPYGDTGLLRGGSGRCEAVCQRCGIQTSEHDFDMLEIRLAPQARFIHVLIPVILMLL